MKKKFALIGLTLMLLVGCGSNNETIPPLPSEFLITFNDEKGNLLESKMWNKNEVPFYDYQKLDTQEWDYTFKGWSESLNGNIVTIPPASRNATYYAVVDAVKQKYNITFYDENGNKLGDSLTEYGTIPAYSYTKQDTQEWDYTVEGWSLTLGGNKLSSLPSVTGNASYYAVVSKTKQKYTITFNSNGGSSVSSITNDYGTSITEPTEPTRDGYNFVCWCSDVSLNNAVTWPYELTSNKTFYAKWNEKVKILEYLKILISALRQDPYSYIPDTLRPTNSKNYVTKTQVDYDFTDFTNVSDIQYGGFGEQWQMVIDNIQQSQKFYVIFTTIDNIVTTSVTAFNNWFDNNPSSTNKEINETGYYAKVDFKNNILSYTLQLKTGINIPFFGEIIPQIDMTYSILTNEKSVRVNLTETNALRYVVSENKYAFGIKYGVDAVSRNAYFELNKINDAIEGHIYEYITLKEKDAVKSCADFYIGETYTSVVGNKATGIVGMDGYINELYITKEGRLLGYKIQETKTFLGITGTYHTLWFNLNNISGISSVKAIPNDNVDIAAKNIHDVYVNGNKTIFKPTYNQVLFKDTSRKYDIEIRTQYRYGLVDEKTTCFETKIPMMFIQDNHDDYTNYSDFEKDILKDNGISASVTLSSTYLIKIRSDYDTLIPLFKINKELVNSDTIQNWIGTVVGN